MVTRKQQILRELLYSGILELRMICASGSRGWWWRLRNRAVLQLGFEHANFLHRVHVSILEPGFTDNDISFINYAFPTHVRRLGSQLPESTARLMVEFYDLVPKPWRDDLSWHPSAELRRMVKGSTAFAEPPEATSAPPKPHTSAEVPSRLTVIWCDRCGRTVNQNDELDHHHPEQCMFCRKYRVIDSDWGFCRNHESVYCGRLMFEHDTCSKWTQAKQ